MNRVSIKLLIVYIISFLLLVSCVSTSKAPKLKIAKPRLVAKTITIPLYTSPSGAKVILDGLEKGVTPYHLRITYAKAKKGEPDISETKTRTLIIKKAGYRPVVSVFSFKKKQYKKIPKLIHLLIDIDEARYKKYLDSNIDDLDPIEGIWTDYESKYKIAIKKEKENEFIAVIVSSEIYNWNKGEIKARFTKTSYGTIYSTTYHTINKNKVGTTSTIDNRGMLVVPVKDSYKGNSTTLLKIYPHNIEKTSKKKTLSKYDNFLDCAVVINSTNSIGTGFFVTNSGYLITNNHVVGNDSNVSIRMRNGQVLLGSVIASDKDRDLALLRVKGDNFPWLTLASGDDNKIGIDVIAIGTPEGYLDWTVSKGIVSAVRTAANGTILIQTDAAINSGNSGGPLISLENGKIIGVNTLSYKKHIAEGLSFAVSADEIRRAFPQFLQ